MTSGSVLIRGEDIAQVKSNVLARHRLALESLSGLCYAGVKEKMMANFDQIGEIKEIDKESMLRHIEELPDQIEQTWEYIQKFVLPANYIKVKNIIMLGMGGSGIGGLLASSLAFLSAKIPICILSDYNLPAYVNEDSLVISVSYSGNTEETLSAFKEAGEKKLNCWRLPLAESWKN